MKNKWIKMTAVAAFVGFSASVQANPITLTSGQGSTSLAGVVLTESGGTLKQSLLNQTMTDTIGNDTGTFSSWVYSGDANNTLNGLTFVYSITLTSGDIAHLSINGFGFPSSVIVGLDSSNGGLITPYQANRSGAGGNPLDFDFGSFGSGTTVLIVVDTSILNYQVQYALFQDGNQANSPALAPNLPDGGATVMLLGAALSAMGLLRRKLIA